MRKEIAVASRNRAFKKLTRLLRRERMTRYEGPFASWEQAAERCEGYDSSAVLEATRRAVSRHLRGEGFYETDSVLVEKPEYSYFMLACVLRVLAESAGTAQIVDFGGALGSSYYQLRSFLGGEPDCVWHVVEQEAHVRCGRAEFESEFLKFHYGIEACLEGLDEPPALLILSGVLHFLPDPYAVLSTLCEHGFPRILIDRTPLSETPAETVYSYTVPTEIYSASYPFWILSRDRLLGAFEPEYELIAQHRDPAPLTVGGDEHSRWGFLLRRFRGFEWLSSSEGIPEERRSG